MTIRTWRVGMLGLLLPAVLVTAAQAGSLPDVRHVDVGTPPDELQDFDDIFRKGSDFDFAMWENNPPTLHGLRDFLKRIIKSETPLLRRQDLVVLVIKDNHPYVGGKVFPWAVSKVVSLAKGITGWYSSTKRHVNDTIMIISPHDAPVCNVPGSCSFPVFSHCKRWNFDTNTGDGDILVPQHFQPLDESYSFPWEQKEEKAFFRGSFRHCWRWNGTERLGDIECGRYQVANYSLDHSDLLDVGLDMAEYWREVQQPTRVPTVPGESMADHARRKYLISLDGVTYSNRLEKLMLINSVVLRERSEFVDVWMRSIVNMTHVVEVDWQRDGLDAFKWAVEYLKEHDAEAYNMMLRSQMFARRYFPARARSALAYFIAQRYTQLVGPQLEAFVKTLPLAPAVVGHPWTELDYSVVRKIAGL